MNRLLIAFSMLCLVTVSGAVFAADASKAPAKIITAFYPGSSGMEWILSTNHGGSRGVKKGESCINCHVDDKTNHEEASEMGDEILAGQKFKDTVLEPDPIKGKPGSVPITVRAAHDGDKLYLQFSWKDTGFVSGKKMDPDSQIKMAVMLYEPGKVEYDTTGGCWATCHNDLRTMHGVTDNNKTKYLVGGDLAAGKFFDIIQFRTGQKPRDGYIAKERVMEGGTALIDAKGELKDGIWTVSFIRKLSGGEGDVKLEPGKLYSFGFSLMDDYCIGRYHYVSFGYSLGLDNPSAGVNVVKQ